MLGLKSEIRVKKAYKFSEQAKRQIVEDYLQSGLSKRAIWEKYTGCPTEHGKILLWMRKYGYTSSHNKEIVTFAAKTGNMRHESKIKEIS